ncbi:hypothetical protein JL722_4965 [Aureococcus anophagefferens]|nr:hypothetical protein JL722_4965 [Aureococcus anophagefferens]
MRSRGAGSRAQLLYSERHLHPRGDGRVAPATALAAFTLCDVAVSRAYTLKMTATAGGEKRVTRGRFAEKTIAERWPRGGFVRGVVEAAEDPQGEAYTVAYSDGPYRTDDASAPPPGYPRGAKPRRRRPPRPLAACPKTGAPRRVVLRACPRPSSARTRRRSAPRRAGPRRSSRSRLLFGVPMEAVHGWRLVLLIYSAGVVAGPLVCAVCDAYAVVVGASGGAYALLGAHVGAIWKDWDRLATGTHIPAARLALFPRSCSRTCRSGTSRGRTTFRIRRTSAAAARVYF